MRLFLPYFTSRRSEGRERRLFVANSFLAGLNLAILTAIAVLLWVLGLPLWGPG